MTKEESKLLKPGDMILIADHLLENADDEFPTLKKLLGTMCEVRVVEGGFIHVVEDEGNFGFYPDEVIEKVDLEIDICESQMSISDLF